MLIPKHSNNSQPYPYLKVIRTALIALGVVVLALFACTRWIESHSVFYPSKDVQRTPKDVGISYEEVTIPTADGISLNAWLVRGSPRSKSIVIYCHGNAGNIGNRIYRLKVFHDLGLNVLLFDYRGFGKSTGRPSEQGIYEDAAAVYDYLANRPDVDCHHIAAYGKSIGGAVVIDLATKRSLAGFVVDSSFSSARDMAELLYPGLPAWFVTYRFDSVSKVRNLKIPKLFIHNPDDGIVPLVIGQRLFAAAAQPKIFVPMRGGHGQGLVYDTRKFSQTLQVFMMSIGMLEE
ncbi:MAG: alpha/beta hydrolase [Syntrophaceae bacterium]|nr:alpha/beta hydrolase [Syntrophaceae bacterium]